MLNSLKVSTADKKLAYVGYWKHELRLDLTARLMTFATD
jgi:hypothetical protein